ncbi:DUF7342 family protein [Halocalculus aciditolerans]|uniref:Transcriptional regulator n=1 Tax=Halocalculus aciditolerans TaxID=1383812 RepID=A0A830FF02_9EURY|nr:ArsR family transcriptional regulator [Halocalculus aciditolerans]GGL68197.1 hypothetical protein GCM10009039_27740 [Halocalculus aciditolerans]
MSGENAPSMGEEWREQRENESTRDRLYRVALQLTEPTRVRAIAERADVSKETARDYLQWFAELGVVEQTNTSPDEFTRNEQYFEWRRIERLRSQPEEALRAKLEDLTEQERAYRDRFDVENPSDVDALKHGDYTGVEDVWEAVQAWRTVRRRIRELERARQSRADDAPAHA